MAKKKTPEKYLPWIEARRRFHLSHAHIQMARELGQNPKKFGGLANTKQEPWKLPMPEFIEELYFKHFKKRRPENVRFIEQMVSDFNRNKEQRRARKQTAPQSQQSSEDA
jgi:fructose-1,6-bisphosphatase